MRVHRETTTLELCSGSDTGLDAPFWQGASQHYTGLRATVVATKNGPRLRVFTGGYNAKYYVPETTHAPVQVQATYTADGAEVTVEKFSATFNFGAPGPVPVDVERIAADEALEFVIAIVASAPSFTSLWDAAADIHLADETDRAAQRTDRALTAVAADIAAAVASVTSQLDGPAPSVADLADNAHVRALAEALIPAADTPTRAVHGAEMVAAARGRLRDAAVENIASVTRLSELEAVALIADRASAGLSVDASDVARRTAQVAYDVLWDIYYGTGAFPDRSPGDTRGN